MPASCPNCGANLTAGASTCPSCNRPVPLSTPQPVNHLIAALTYILGFVTGIIFLYLEPYNSDDFVRFHAHQSIAFSVAAFVFNVIVSVFIHVLPGALSSLLGVLASLVYIALALYWVFLMYQAYIGNRYRIPILSDWVDSALGSSH